MQKVEYQRRHYRLIEHTQEAVAIKAWLEQGGMEKTLITTLFLIMFSRATLPTIFIMFFVCLRVSFTFSTIKLFNRVKEMDVQFN